MARVLPNAENPTVKVTSPPSTLSSDFPNCSSVTVSPDIFIPIFILTRDRLSSTRATIQSYRKTLSSQFEIIVLDHNSTYPHILQYFKKQQEHYNLTIHHLYNDDWDTTMEKANGIIQAYLEQRPEVKYYVFTDPDIAFLRTNPDALLFYAGLLDSCPWLNVVGPHLQISDIPAIYQRKYLSNYSVYEWESQYWKTVPHMATWKGSGYHVSEQLIDTTFGMRRRDLKLARITCPCVRAYAPYAAVHVDWYFDTENPPKDKEWYLKRQRGVNNW